MMYEHQRKSNIKDRPIKLFKSILLEGSNGERYRKAPPEYLNGFPTFAAYIASDPELAIYRKFDFLSARNLLYLQGELITLEAELKEFDALDLIQERK